MWSIYGTELKSRLLVGSAMYASPEQLQQVVEQSGTEVVTVSLRRQGSARFGDAFWQTLKGMNCHILPNTAGCKSEAEVLTLAQMSREVFATDWIKLELIGDDYTLAPDPIALVSATEKLIALGFKVLPYCTDDLVVCQRLADLGCEVVMPWGAPIGSGKGLINRYNLSLIRSRLKEVTLIVDAGMGCPSHACEAMALGYDGVLLNSAIAKANHPAQMAQAFAKAVDAGHLGYQAGRMAEQQHAHASTPIVGMPFWHQESE